MNEHNLEASPIRETNADQIEANLLIDEMVPVMTDPQAQERIRRLSEELRALVDINKKQSAEFQRMKKDFDFFKSRYMAFDNVYLEPKNIKEKISCYDYFEKSQDYSQYRTDHNEIVGSPKHLLNAAVGIVEEFWEVNQVLETENYEKQMLLEELGDLQFYIAMYADANFGHDTFENFQNFIAEYEECRHEDIVSLSKRIIISRNSSMCLLSNAKKRFFYSHGALNENEALETIKEIQLFVVNICNFIGWSLSEVYENNLAKIKKRFPSGKFVVEDGIKNR